MSAVPAEVTPAHSAVFHRFLDLPYPNVDRGEGVRLYLTDGTEILDATAGGAMVTALGHGRRSIVDAAAEQTLRIGYVYNHHFTNDAQERLGLVSTADELPDLAHVRDLIGKEPDIAEEYDLLE